MERRLTKRAGFTLIELLVVIAIIAILAAILFPVFAQARDKARQTTCLSNIKQLTLAVMQYSQDYDETLLYRPTGSLICPWQYICQPGPRIRWYLDWWDVVLPYTKNALIYHCPSAARINSSLLQNYGLVNVAIGYNLSVSGAATMLVRTPAVNGINPGVTLAEVTRPADTIMLGEAGRVWNRLATAAPFASTNNASPSLSWGITNNSGSEWGPQMFHGGGANLGFLDGHSKWMRPERFYGDVDWTTGQIKLDCNGIWFRANRDQRVAGDPPAPACGQ